MKLSDYDKVFQDFSDRASDVARKAAFAGIAIAWIFKSEANQIGPSFIWPSLFIVASLLLDFFQYVSGAIIWERITKKREDELRVDPDWGGGERFDEEKEFTVNKWAITIIDCFWYPKIVAMIIAYTLLGIELTRLVWPDTC